MNTSIGKRLLFGLSLLCVFFLLAINGHGAEKRDKESPSAKIKAGKEILVARDIGRGDEASGLRWCGKNGVLYKGKSIGIELIDIKTRNRVLISRDPHDRPLNCTPDGRWVLYTDFSTLHDDPAYEYEEGAFLGWMGEVVDIYRYEVATGRREKVATVRTDVPDDALSPDGKKIFLGARHSFSADVEAPQWEGLWLTNEWNAWSKWSIGQPVWFPDSSGVVLDRFYPNGICVEKFGGEGWAKCFDLGPEYGNISSSIYTDEQNKISFPVAEDSSTDEKQYILYRCDVEDKELSCKKILLRDKAIHRHYGFLPNGDMVFKDSGHECILLAAPGQSDANCIWDSRYGEETYNSIELYGISPNGRWLISTKSHMITSPDGEFAHWEDDLFVIDIKND